ncbi:hypothetical protein, partial [Tropheryma whipplei]|uniref:hypothetical protein n=1 Tax=Tropheryma whipplei TaxID=2039 RepID=UPI0005A5F9D2
TGFSGAGLAAAGLGADEGAWVAIMCGVRRVLLVVVQPGLLQKELVWQELVPMVLQVQVPREL